MRALRLLLAAWLALAGGTALCQETPAAQAPGAAAPDPAAAARAAYRRGADLYRAGQYREAIAAFEEADRLKPSPALHFNVGQAWEKLGDPAAALAAFARYLRLDPAAPNRPAVERTIRALEARLAATGRQMLHVTVDAPEARVSVDGAAPVAAPLDAPFAPGPHQLTGSAPGRREATREVLLPAERSLEVALVLEPLPPPVLAARAPPPPLEATRPDPAPQPVERKNWLGPIIAGSVGVVAAAVGVAMGVSARNAQDQLLAGGNDRSQADALQSKARSDATAANVLYGVAGAAVLTGGVLAIAF